MLTIRTAQMAALQEARQREFVASVVDYLSGGHAALGAHCGPDELTAIARHGTATADRLGLVAADDIRRFTVCTARLGTGYAGLPGVQAILNDDLLAPGEKLRRLEHVLR